MYTSMCIYIYIYIYIIYARVQGSRASHGIYTRPGTPSHSGNHSSQAASQAATAVRPIHAIKLGSTHQRVVLAHIYALSLFPILSSHLVGSSEAIWEEGRGGLPAPPPTPTSNLGVLVPYLIRIFRRGYNESFQRVVITRL